jgi:SAM-dependent methyltransferase
MSKNDDNNLVLVESVEGVDRINAEFYARFPYPWQALKFEYLEDPYFEMDMLNQELGDWAHQRLPKHLRIWVAGCGTNQAVVNALKFPKASVVGSDISSTSLEISARSVTALGISNLKLERESINQVTYQDEFDYIISTGVIHHNADPQVSLNKLSAALKPGGILELMVYNKFHWSNAAAFQKAIRILGENSAALNFEWELSAVKKIMQELPQESTVGDISKYRTGSEAALADELLQPVLHHYTVESLGDLAESCGLELLLPCSNHFDTVQGTTSWNIDFKDQVLRETYHALPDLRRWQVTNLLLRERSPQLWFYLQRKDGGRERRTEQEVCEEFLQTKFVRAETLRRGYMQTQDGGYRLLPKALHHPLTQPDDFVKEVFEAADGESSMREIFRRLERETTFEAVNKTRLLLTTRQTPYLRSVEANR